MTTVIRSNKVTQFLTSGNGGPNGSRTRVLALRGLCPRPLDDGTDHQKEIADRDNLIKYNIQM